MKIVLRSVLNEIREGAHRAAMNGRSVERVELTEREYRELRAECAVLARFYSEHQEIAHVMGIPIKVVP